MAHEKKSKVTVYRMHVREWREFNPIDVAAAISRQVKSCLDHDK
jgi:hypothetical protein